MNHFFSLCNARHGALLTLLGLLLALGGRAQFAQPQKLTPLAQNRQENAVFGMTTAVDGDVMVVGAPGEPGGAAYVFEKSGGTWQQTARLVTTDGTVLDGFGKVVAVSGTTVAVGAPTHDMDANGQNLLFAAGAVYVFGKSGNAWQQTRKLVADDRSFDANFGNALAFSGTTLAVGAFKDAGENTEIDAGAVYVFGKSGNAWQQTAKLVAADRTSGGNFGHAVALSGTILAVGATAEERDANGQNPLLGAGAAYVFEKSGGSWQQVAKLVASDRTRGASFGYAVATSGSTVAVGARQQNTDANGQNPLVAAGAAYVFEKSVNVWPQVAKLVASDRAMLDLFGSSVALSGTTLVVGATGQDTDAAGANAISGAGAAYVFGKSETTWQQTQKLVASDRASSSAMIFGVSVALSGTTVAVGAFAQNSDADGQNLQTNAGAAYVFSHPCSLGTPTLAGVPLCAGQSLTLTVPTTCATGLEAQLSDAEGGFDSPVSLGSVAAGSQSVVVPPGTPSGRAYRVRLVSQSPASNGPPSEPFRVNTLGPVFVGLFPATPSRLCQGQALPVTFSIASSCPLPVGNVFTVQLSSATGSFANPTVLGTASPGTTNFALPQNLPVGTGYRVRVLSSNPAQTSASSLPFELRSPSLGGVTPGVGGVPSGGICRGQAVTVSFSLPAGNCPFPGDNGFTAQLSNATGSFTSPVSLGVVRAGVSNSLTIPATSAAGTGYRIRVVSSNPPLTSSNSIPFRVNACVSRLSAEEPELVVAPNPAVGGELRVRVRGLDKPQFGLTSSAGRSVAIVVKTDGAGGFVLTPRQALVPGVYVVGASEGAARLTQRVLVAE